MADWVTISALSTAGGTLVLAGAAFASVRSANRAARVAEQSLLVNLRPLLVVMYALTADGEALVSSVLESVRARTSEAVRG